MDESRVIVVDIETCATTDPTLISIIRDKALSERAPSSVTETFKEIYGAETGQLTARDVKIIWDTEEMRRKRVDYAISRTSVDVTMAEIILAVALNGGDYLIYGLDSHPDEAEMLRALRDALADVSGPETIWVGHNITGFDLPVLTNRFRRHGITPPQEFPQFRDGRWYGRIYDTMTRFPCRTPYISLEQACSILGVPQLNGYLIDGELMDGSRVGYAYREGRWDVLVPYCREDVRATADLYRRMTFDDSWGTYDRGVREMVAEIREHAESSPAEKAMAIVALLERAKWI